MEEMFNVEKAIFSRGKNYFIENLMTESIQHSVHPTLIST